MTTTDDIPLRMAVRMLTELRAQKARRALGARYEALYEGPGEWRNPDTRRAFAVVIATTEITAPDACTVVAQTPRTQHGYIWSYVAREALEAAAPTERPYRIDQTDPHTYTLTWK